MESREEDDKEKNVRDSWGECTGQHLIISISISIIISSSSSSVVIIIIADCRIGG